MPVATNTNHVRALLATARAYKRADERAAGILAAPRANLTAAVKAAFADGVSKAEILELTEGVWSRSWLDKLLGRRTRVVPGQDAGDKAGASVDDVEQPDEEAS